MSRQSVNGGVGGKVRRVVQVCLFSLTVMSVPAHAVGVVADGGTATSVSTAASGHQVVSIAPAVGGVSHNTYSHFNVGSAGVDLNNVGINARTIVNQVTSTDQSVISGQLAVLGSRANVVIANPNGITLNGGSFVNTGHVALSTGQVSFNDVLTGSVLQRNVVLDTKTGTIVVGPQGLSSALVALDLIAKNILVNGPLTNTFTSSTATVRLLGGTSNVTLNTGVSPNDNANDWLSLNASATHDTANSFAVDITAAGSLTSGRVQLIVTDKGPGVRSAGPMNATLGDFTLTSNGAVEFSNTTLDANDSVSMQVQDALTATSMQIKAGNAATIASTGLLGFNSTSLLTGGGIHLSGGGVKLYNDSGLQTVVASTNAGVVVKSSQDIVNIGSLVQGQTQTTSDSDSKGAVTLNASGNVVNQSTTASKLGVLFGVNGDVVVTAGGNITNEDARILSNSNVTLTASGDVDNIIDHSSGVNGGTAVGYSNKSLRLIFVQHHENGFTVDYGALGDPDKLSYITADSGNVTISARNLNNVGGSILSNDGSISISAAQNLLTQGVFTGQASYHQSCFIFCSASASSTVQAFGGVMEAGKDITLKAGTQITNTGGTVIAIGNLKLDAPKTLAQGVLGYTVINRRNDLKTWFGNTWAAIYAADTGGIFTGGNGQVELTGEADIDGGAFNAPGGIHAAGGVNTIRAPYRAPVTIGNHNHLGLVSWFGL
ncbi:filamentous hemagglutinin N-terminal domain-containing protein [Paraburkholderia hospita]|uniref:two-partner secretion domain-containing protein n=1 Tax=Paraburkholderia hospita TaxID=169430 RepID=UPI0002719CA7|nr:filamentous hemagglutinin family outer membrane protein [Burkholderia sp. BT03]SKC49096.1 filamentous hemagglutinin family N-terminal domain-containing protein [Paraburkholderia hospita]